MSTLRYFLNEEEKMKDNTIYERFKVLINFKAMSVEVKIIFKVLETKKKVKNILKYRKFKESTFQYIFFDDA